MKRMTVIIIMTLTLLPAVVTADTGTYKITDYQVELTPKSDGLVVISYQQTWLVESGHIPWIKVGVPNSNFEIVGHGNATKTIKKANESGWSGVRIDLDQDYKPGQSFTVTFAISQNKLFYTDDKYYKLDFTPGWYDRAFTDRLDLSVRFFAPIDSVSAKPKPSRVEGQKMYWSKTKLGKGERVSISVQFPKSSFAGKMSEENLKGNGDIGAFGLILLIILAVVVIIVIVGIITGGFDPFDSDSGGGGGSYSGGHIYVGGSRGSSRSGQSSGGGGGFGGRSSSCACACVSCACACACAGGGGAGCSRKLEHLCSKCSNNDQED